VVDALLGGLSYQIEHHLFPSMPRGSLRRAQPTIRAYWLENGLPYAETSLFDSYRQALRHLHSAGRAAQPREEPELSELGRAVVDGSEARWPGGPGRTSVRLKYPGIDDIPFEVPAIPAHPRGDVMSLLNRIRSAPADPATAAPPRHSADPPATSPTTRPSRTGAAWFGICVAALIVVVLIVFMAQNTRSVAWHPAAGPGPADRRRRQGILAMVIGTARITQLRRASRRQIHQPPPGRR
jgi:uncharacterized integral membrane protein